MIALFWDQTKIYIIHLSAFRTIPKIGKILCHKLMCFKTSKKIYLEEITI